MLTKLKWGVTACLALAVLVFGYQFLPTRTEQERRDALFLSVLFTPDPLPKGDPNPVDVDVYIYPPDKPPQKYHFARRTGLVDYPVNAETGSRVLFSAIRTNASLTSLSCSIKYHGKQVKFDNIPAQGMVNCDWIVR